MKKGYSTVTLHGEHMDEPMLADLGRLRMQVFRDYPYLYDGDATYEQEYLRRYLDSEDSHFILVFDNVIDQLVGATTCLPLKDEAAEFRNPLEEAGFDISQIFYFGESVLLPEWRGQGLGKFFFDIRESHARELGYPITSFCAVDRPPNHPMQPESYRPLDGFWQKRGYEKQDNIKANFPWKEVGDQDESDHLMTFWLRHWEPLPKLKSDPNEILSP